MAYKYITVGPDQSVWDLAIQEYGSTEGVAQLLLDNAGLLDLEVSPEPGTKIKIDDSKIVNKDVVSYLKEKGVKPANDSFVELTEILLEDDTELLNEDDTPLITEE